MKYYIIAGEASGDLHGSSLIRELKLLDTQAQIRFWGGDLMSHEAKSDPVKHYKDLAFMGPWEVLKNIRTILRNIAFCKRDIVAFNPDAIIFIDYPGFNLRIAKWAKQKNFVTHYYIAPQVWAWNEKRVESMRACIDKLYVILPFEKDFFEKKHNMPVKYVGHPLVDVISRHQPTALELSLEDEKPIVALLPGSRRHEVQKMLPVFATIAQNFPDYRFIIAGLPIFSEDFYMEHGKGVLEVVYNQTYDLLSQAKAAIVTSGTATLETALFKVPQVVCYKTSKISYHLMKLLIRVKYISLVNLIMDRKIVNELIQQDCNEQMITDQLEHLLNHPEQILSDYKELYNRLDEKHASKEVAKEVFNSLNG